MAGALVIPGVQVAVVKQVLPQQLSPSGVLGLIGFTELNPGKAVRVSNFGRLIELLGRSTALSLPEARQALDNGISELVISPLGSAAGARASLTFPKKDATPQAAGFSLLARVPGPWANGISASVKYRQNLDDSTSFDLTLARQDGTTEVLRNLNTDKQDSAQYIVKALADSAIARVDTDKSIGWPQESTQVFAGGKDATATDYAAALARLKDESDVDMVLAAVQDFSNPATVARIYGDVISHCNNLSDECKGRIGFGQVPVGSTAAASVQLASNLVSDRFVLVAPNGVVGAVAGVVGNLSYFDSPTFKRVSGLGVLDNAITVEDQRALLTGRVVPVVTERAKGTVVLRGLTTDGDQINVRRVADHAVRGMKMIGDLFIGLLNNADGRNALKQKLSEFLVQMQKEGAIVPSTDGTDPAFKVEVYSSQADFALGIVRVNMAIRPVRAIDYIYATITVQV
ncbi:phage tail sheath C-terminal domain-containing protein [Archangium violaceum]|uniref:phage tail sheath C-terminal domain-containing protein n=1 Tax=Archangium violaceum TaxID=83451 RepID=UPI0036DDD1FB